MLFGVGCAVLPSSTAVIYYGQVKPVGSEKETPESSAERSVHHLRQVLMRLSTYATQRDTNIMGYSTDDKPRRHAVETMSEFHLLANLTIGLTSDRLRMSI